MKKSSGMTLIEMIIA
ncbi:prepilin-type N-terminal cleavage/methylation domain-containing protein, partial [Vibrio parahaemolyticus]